MKSDPTLDESNEPREVESSPPLLARYLNDVCQHDLLTRKDEERIGKQLKEARVALGQLIAKLPPRCRDYVLDGAKPGKNLAGQIDFARLETRLARLEKYAKAHPGKTVEAMLDRARKHKRLMDQAKDEMVNANLRLVIHIVKHYCRNGSPDLDLIQDGSIGLLKAVEKFEYEKGYKFSTYAHWWIRQAVTRALTGRTRTVHIPSHLIQTLRKIQRAHDDLSDKLGREPTREELSERADVPLDKLDELLKAYSQPDTATTP